MLSGPLRRPGLIEAMIENFRFHGLHRLHRDSLTSGQLHGMEATSARMAARDRFGAMRDPGPSPLQRYIRSSTDGVSSAQIAWMLTSLIESACDPQNYEPNLALVLDIADMINAKKGNALVAPRGVTVCRHVRQESFMLITSADLAKPQWQLSTTSTIVTQTSHS